jgi:hypothetical protein
MGTSEPQNHASYGSQVLREECSRETLSCNLNECSQIFHLDVLGHCPFLPEGSSISPLPPQGLLIPLEGGLHSGAARSLKCEGIKTSYETELQGVLRFTVLPSPGTISPNACCHSQLCVIKFSIHKSYIRFSLSQILQFAVLWVLHALPISFNWSP